jgi:hypothetical protein
MPFTKRDNANRKNSAEKLPKKSFKMFAKVLVKKPGFAHFAFSEFGLP